MPTLPTRLIPHRGIPLLIAVLAFATFVGLHTILPTSNGQTGSSATQISKDDHRDLYDAEQILVAHCMQKAGFHYRPQPYTDPTPDGSEFPFLPWSVSSAEQYGFHSANATRADPNLNYFTGLSKGAAAQYVVDLNGGGPGTTRVQATSPQGFIISHSTGGCVAVAEGVLYGNFAARFTSEVTVENLPPIWQTKVQADPSYIRVKQSWARCIHAFGLSYPTPQSASDQFTSGTLSQLEINTAVATRKCANDVHMDDVVNRLDDHYETAVDRTYAKEVDIFRALELKASPLARNLVSSDGNLEGVHQ